MYMDMTNKTILDINSIVTDLKELLDKIIKKLSLNDEKNESIDDLVEIFSCDEDFCNDLSLMKNNLNEIVLILESSEVFSDEYVDFLSIKCMCDYIIEDIKLYILYSSFINSILFNFFKLIHSKIHEDNSSYSNMYSNFERFLDEKERFFYLKIYDGSHEYDNLIDDVTRILG